MTCAAEDTENYPLEGEDEGDIRDLAEDEYDPADDCGGHFLLTPNPVFSCGHIASEHCDFDCPYREA